ncbi:MAG TPA: MFS transporter [Thermaerobacter sp.]
MATTSTCTPSRTAGSFLQVAGDRRETPSYPARRWLLLAAATLQQAGLTFVRFGIPVLAPFARADLGLSLGETGVLLGAFDFGALLTFYVTGRLTDRLGERVVMAAGAVITGLLAAAAAASGSFTSLVVWLTLAGIGFPSSQVAGSQAVIGWFPVRERGLAMGIRQAGLPAGGFAAALALAWIAHLAGWRQALLVAAMGCAASGLLTYAILPREHPAVAGAARGEAARWHTQKRRTPPPCQEGMPGPRNEQAGGESFWALPRWFLRNRPVLLTTLMACLLAAVQFSITGYLPLFLEDLFRWPRDAAARLLLAVHAGGMAGRLAWGWLSDRVYRGERTRPLAVVAICGAAVSAGLALLARFTGAGAGGSLSPGVALLVAMAFAAGFTCLGWNGLYTTLVAEQAGIRSASVLGLSMTVLYVATMLAPPAFGHVVELAGDYSVAWASLVVLQVLALGAIAGTARALATSSGGARRDPAAGL